MLLRYLFIEKVFLSILATLWVPQTEVAFTRCCQSTPYEKLHTFQEAFKVFLGFFPYLANSLALYLTQYSGFLSIRG